MQEILNILKSIRPDVDFENQTNLATGGIIDSLDIVNLISKIDDDLGVQIPFTELLPENLDSIEAIAQLVERCR